MSLSEARTPVLRLRPRDSPVRPLSLDRSRPSVQLLVILTSSTLLGQVAAQATRWSRLRNEHPIQIAPIA